MSFGRPHRAVLSSGIALAIAIGLFFPFYRMLLAAQRPPGAVTDLKFGKYGYLLRDNRGRCAGWIRYELEYDGSYSFLVDGSLHYSLNGEADRVVLKAGAGFNSLNQLSATYMRISHHDREYRVETDGITPITVKFRGEIGERVVQLERTFPGPIEIYEPEEGNFVIRSQALPNFDFFTQHLKTATPFEPVLPFVVEEQREDSEEQLQALCEKTGEAPLSIDFLFNLFQKAASLASLRL